LLSEEEFRGFYDRTARPLKAYLVRMTSNAQLSDDLLQESYLRLLQSERVRDISEEHRKNYLFRIATNLMRDHARRRTTESNYAAQAQPEQSSMFNSDVDLERMLDQLPVKQKELLWLAYVEGMSHAEIANVVGIRCASVRPTLARARSRLSEILKVAGWAKVGAQ
jgi:RNA polymerase sigma-70 factor (ECF subfamily)